jgi:hypothetical protein
VAKGEGYPAKSKVIAYGKDKPQSLSELLRFWTSSIVRNSKYYTVFISSFIFLRAFIPFFYPFPFYFE